MQVFRAIKNKVGDIVIPQHFAIEQAPETEEELVSRNEYLLRLGITGIWFEKGRFDYVEDMLRLGRNELRYRGVMPGSQASTGKEKERPIGRKPGFISRLMKFLFG